MATYVPAKRATAYILYVGLVSQANTKILRANPTLAAGDFKVSIDGGALANLATLPTVTPAAGAMVKISLSVAEMTGDNITILCIDAAGAEWCDLIVNIQTAARQIDDLAYPATSGRSMVVDAAGLVDANTVKLGPSGTGTAQTAKDVGGAVPAVAAGASGGILISGANTGTTTLGALTVTGMTTHTGNMVLSDGLTISAPSTLNRAGVSITGNGSGAGILSTGGAAVTTTAGGHGISVLGGASSTGVGGTAGVGMRVIGGAGSASQNGAAEGMTLIGGGTNTVASNAHGLSIAGASTGHGTLTTSGAGATGDGLRATAASTNGHGISGVKTGTGSDLNATITPLVLAKTTNITGFNDIAATAIVSAGAITTNAGAVSTVTSVSGSVGSVTGAVGSVTGNVGGNVVGSVASVTAGVTLAASAVQAIWDALTTALTTAGSIGKKLADWVIGTTQTGDSFARLGAPAGASVSADIAAVKVDTAAVKTKTDQLAFGVANVVNSNVTHVIADPIIINSVKTTNWGGT